MLTFLCSALHFLVDFTCAHAMLRLFTGGSGGYVHILLYNFCAFALQMPLGVLLDSLSERRCEVPRIFVALGVLLTILGSVTHPVLLGLGNALFHVGGGVGVIREDNARRWKGRALGIFVAPGALGLFIGAQLAGLVNITCIPAAAMVILALPLFFLHPAEASETPSRNAKTPFPALLCCFLVVILRSYVGMAVAFPWKQGLVMGLAATVAVVLGKAAGGLAAARFGTRNTVVISLVLAMACYFLGDEAVFGIGALFFFNMTMPITLYQSALLYPRLPGFCFGLLTFGLFLGFLPVYFGAELPVAGTSLGALGCLASLALLLPAVNREGL